MSLSEAHVPTTHAASYMKQLCRHWAHKFPVTFDDQHGRIDLPKATCLLQATPDKLEVRLTTHECADEARMQQVISEHLQRFGFREEVAFHWKASAAA